MINSASWTGRYPRYRAVAVKFGAFRLSLDAPENTLHFRARPVTLRRLQMRLAEWLYPKIVGAPGLWMRAKRYRMERLNWMRPYLRTGAIWWRPMVSTVDRLEVFDVENGSVWDKSFSEYPEWLLSRDAWSERVMLFYDAPKTRVGRWWRRI